MADKKDVLLAEAVAFSSLRRALSTAARMGMRAPTACSEGAETADVVRCKGPQASIQAPVDDDIPSSSLDAWRRLESATSRGPFRGHVQEDMRFGAPSRQPLADDPAR